jgi:hypothetical protein
MIKSAAQFPLPSPELFPYWLLKMLAVDFKSLSKRLESSFPEKTIHPKEILWEVSL